MTCTFNSRRGVLKAALGLLAAPLTLDAAHAGFKYRVPVPKISPTDAPNTTPSCPASLALSVRQLVPAYFWDGAEWAKLAASPPADVIFNPNSGPYTEIDIEGYKDPESWGRYWLGLKLSEARAAGHTIFGYVRTNFGASNLSDILAEVQAYVQYWGITDIFLDETTADPEGFTYYQELYNQIKAVVPTARVIFNPGYLSDALIPYFDLGPSVRIVTYEQSYSAWAARYRPAWHSAYRSRSYVLVHGCSQAEQEIVLDAARAEGYLGSYCTDRVLEANPWETLSSYWGLPNTCQP